MLPEINAPLTSESRSEAAAPPLTIGVCSICHRGVLGAHAGVLFRCVRFVSSFRSVMRYARRSSDITRCSAIGLLTQRAPPATLSGITIGIPGSIGTCATLALTSWASDRSIRTRQKLGSKRS